MSSKIVIKNKKASHLFEIKETYTAGIQLTGTEIKSIRQGKASLVDTYCYFKNNELWLKGMHITEYDHSTHFNHEPKRDRKLLLKKQELKKLQRKVKEKGFTIIALKAFISEKGYAKVEIALASGKKKFDKREEIKRKDMKRDMERSQKY
ncbi:MAG: SsrA-binding protein SmpB [Bacteroidales bacterium]